MSVKKLEAGPKIQRSGLFILINPNRTASKINVPYFEACVEFFLNHIESFLVLKNKEGTRAYAAARFEPAATQYRVETGPKLKCLHVHALVTGSTLNGYMQLDLPCARDWWEDKLGFLPLIRVKKASVTGAGIENYMRKD